MGGRSGKALPSPELRELRGRGAPEELLSVDAARLYVEVCARWDTDDPAGRALVLEAARCRERIDEARALVARDGVTIRGARGQRIAHPALAVERSARLQLVQTLRALDLSPEAS